MSQVHAMTIKLHSSVSSRALALNISAYLLWAVATILFKQLGNLSIWMVFAQRILWSLLFCVVLLAGTGGFHSLVTTIGTLRQWKYLVLTSLLIATNWFLVIWAIGAGHLLDASLGYYFAPLISLMIAKIGLRERWRRGEYLPVLFSSFGVLLIAFSAGLNAFPWVALIVATTFALYSAIKKLGNVPPLVGLTLETGIAAVPAVIYLVYLANTTGYWLPDGMRDRVLLVGIGFVTTVPMLFYVKSVRSLTMTQVSNLQFLNPTFMFLIAIFVFHESVNEWRLVGFAMIWGAMLYRFFEDSTQTVTPDTGHDGLVNISLDIPSQSTTCPKPK